MGVGQAAELAGHAGPVAIGGVRVAGPVGEGVVAAVDGDPADDVALETHRPGDRERDPQRAGRRERTVREQPVEPHADPQAGQHVEGQRQQDIGQAKTVAPGQPHCDSQACERDEHDRGGYC